MIWRGAFCFCLAIMLAACGGTTQEEDGLGAENNSDNNAENNDNNAENNDNNAENNDNNTENNDNNAENNDNNGPDSCASIETRYDETVAAAQDCDEAAQCVTISGQCGVGLGGCFEFVNDASIEEALAALGQDFSGGECTEGVCDCPPAPPAACEAGKCTEGPYCPENEVGDTWMVDCNTCECTFDGVVCTEEACASSCEDIELDYAQALTQASSCREHSDCRLLEGQCSVGLGGCYEAANETLTQETLTSLGQSYSEGECTGAVCDCAGPPAVVCREGSCALGPDCEGFQIGETWDDEDGCNTCECTPRGVSCTELPCNQDCRTDADCLDGFWCRDREGEGRECVPFQDEGDSCGGFTPRFAENRCDPSLTCTDFLPFIPDAPGKCRVPCGDQTSCGDDDYCSTNNACRDHGTCFHPLDCDISQNEYLRERCIGHGQCNRNTCEWVCEPSECRDVASLEAWFGFCDQELGFAIVDGTCRSVSGCEDLGLRFFPDLRSCNNSCGD